MPQERQWQAVGSTKSAVDHACRVGSARVPSWLVECLRLGVGHARNRPARSLHPGRGGRTRLPPRGPLVGPLQERHVPELTFEEAAERLGTTPRHMRRLVLERRIAYRKLGRYVRFHPDDLAENIAAHRVEVGHYPEVG
jgi:excisionase family DNA binding protein